MRMPNHATAYEPSMPTIEKRTTIDIFIASIWWLKYQTMMAAMKAQRIARNLPCVTR